MDIAPANTVIVELPPGATNSKPFVLEGLVVLGGSTFVVALVVVFVQVDDEVVEEVEEVVVVGVIVS